MTGGGVQPGRAARRSWWVFAAMVMGILAGRERPMDAATLFASAGLAASAALMVRGRFAGLLCRGLLLLAVVLAGIAWWGTRQMERSPRDLRVVASLTEDQTPVVVEGVLLTNPELVKRTPGAMFPGMLPRSHRFELSLRSVGEPSRACEGVLLASVVGDAEGLRAGDRVRVSGLYRPIEGPLNPGAFDFRMWATDRGVVGRLVVPARELIAALPAGGAASELNAKVLRLRAAAVRRAVDVMDRAFTPEPSSQEPPGWRSGGNSGAASEAVRALAMSLLLGRSDAEHAEIDSAFNRLGLSHILAISGFHIVILAGVCLFLVRLFGEWGRLEPLLVALLVVGYLGLVPAGAPVVRAGVMVLVMLIAEALGRSYDRLTLLGWIAVGLLIWRPGDLFTLGFPLSLGLTAALLGLGDLAHERLWGVELRGTLDRPGRGLLPWLWVSFKASVATSVLCWSLAFPLVIARTGTITPLAAAWTLIVTPLIAPAMALGFAMLVAGMVIPSLAGVIGPAVGWPLEKCLALVEVLQATPGASLRVVGATPAWALGATLLIAAWYRLGHWRDARCWACAAILAAWLAVLVARAGRLDPDVALRLDVLAMGEGTCQVVRIREGERTRVMMVDCGSTRTDLGRRTVPDALRALGIARVEKLVLTSPDPSRSSAVMDMARVTPVDELCVSREVMDEAVATPTGAMGRLIDEMTGRGVVVRVLGAGDGFEIGPVRAECLWPAGGDLIPSRSDRSLVLELRLGDQRVLFTSDIRPGAIAGLRQLAPELRAAVVEAPARGAAEHGAIAWVAELAPLVVHQSSADRDADARWSPVRERARWLTTGGQGAVWIELTRAGQIRTGKFTGTP